MVTTYDIDKEARIVCDALDTRGGNATIRTAMGEAFQAGQATPLPTLEWQFDLREGAPEWTVKLKMPMADPFTPWPSGLGPTPAAALADLAKVIPPVSAVDVDEVLF